MSHFSAIEWVDFARRLISPEKANLKEASAETCDEHPGGLDLFFEEISVNAVPGIQPDPSKLAPIFERHGLSLAGPPLAARITANT